jgi:hypothetical protein
LDRRLGGPRAVLDAVVKRQVGGGGGARRPRPRGAGGPGPPGPPPPRPPPPPPARPPPPGNLSLHHRIQNGSGPTQPPIQWVPGALSLGVKRPGLDADHSPPSNAEVKEWMELYLHSPNTRPWRGAQLKRWDNFTFCLLFII